MAQVDVQVFAQLQRVVNAMQMHLIAPQQEIAQLRDQLTVESEALRYQLKAAEQEIVRVRQIATQDSGGAGTGAAGVPRLDLKTLGGKSLQFIGQLKD